MIGEDMTIDGLKLLTPKIFADDRGYFFESFNARAFREAAEVDVNFVQDNESSSVEGVLRGLHYQIVRPQGKLVRVVDGEIFDVAVDLRRSSPTFGKWCGVTLSSENKQQLWIPVGFAHGFLVLSESAIVAYKATDYYAPEGERSLAWNDPKIGIDWPLSSDPIVSDKDRAGLDLDEADAFE